MTAKKAKTPLLIDTDVLIDYLRGYSPAIRLIESLRSKAYVSVITMAELHAGVRDEEEQEILSAFLHIFEQVPVSAKIAVEGGLLRRDFGRKHGTGLADALIAATASHVGAQLVTLNKKHFAMLESVQIPYRKR